MVTQLFESFLRGAYPNLVPDRPPDRFRRLATHDDSWTRPLFEKARLPLQGPHLHSPDGAPALQHSAEKAVLFVEGVWQRTLEGGLQFPDSGLPKRYVTEANVDQVD